MQNNKVIIKKIKKDMRGLFANEDMPKNSLIFILKGNHMAEPTRTSIRVRDKNIEHYEGGLMNHHCNPSTEIRIIKNVKEGFVIAKKHINKGEEITFDYESVEPKLSHPFHCDCHGKLIVGRDEQ